MSEKEKALSAFFLHHHTEIKYVVYVQKQSAEGARRRE